MEGGREKEGEMGEIGKNGKRERMRNREGREDEGWMRKTGRSKSMREG